MTDRYLRIGSVIKTHGLKGGLKVFPTTDDPKRFSPAVPVFLDTPEGFLPVTIQSASLFKKIYIVVFKEFTDINEVEAFRGCDIYIERSDEEKLSDNEYYIDDLIGMPVFDEEDVLLGKIGEVMKTGANDVYVVASEDREILLPAIKECILDVDLQENKMKVHLMPGLV